MGDRDDVDRRKQVRQGRHPHCRARAALAEQAITLYRGGEVLPIAGELAAGLEHWVPVVIGCCGASREAEAAPVKLQPTTSSSKSHRITIEPTNLGQQG